MNDLFLIIALLLPQLGSPSGPALCWTDIVIKDSTQVVYRHSCPVEYSQFGAGGKLDYRAAPIYHDGKMRFEQRVYLRSAAEFPFLIDRFLTYTYNDQGGLDRIQTDNWTAWDGHPPSEIISWRFYAYGKSIEVETSFTGDGTWEESILRTLDSSGRCARSISLSNIGAIKTDVRFTRDEAGKITGFFFGGNNYGIKYVFDAQGNWTLLTMTAIPKLVQPLILPWSIQREIVYDEPSPAANINSPSAAH